MANTFHSCYPDTAKQSMLKCTKLDRLSGGSNNNHFLQHTSLGFPQFFIRLSLSGSGVFAEKPSARA